MKNNKRMMIINLSQKKLNIIDILKLYRFFLELPYNDITYVKLFIEKYYQIESLPTEFYQLFLYCVHSNQYKELFDIILSKNIYKLISFLKHDCEIFLDIEDLINPKDYFEIPYKHINYIIEHLKSLDIKNNQIALKETIINNPHWLLRRLNHNTEEEYKKIAIKMYYSIGLDNSIEILSGKYGLIDYEIIHFLFNNLNIKNNTEKNNITFNDFLFSNKKDPNNTFRQMIEGKFNDLFINFDYFYNSLSYFIEKLGTKLSKNKVSILLRERYLAPKLENPELSGDILSDMISSYYHKYGITDSESEILDKNITAYNLKLKNKIKSSIIYTEIPIIDEYIFELIPLNDARNLVMGYRAGNCFRINGDAFILFNNFLSNPHMRILSISTKEYKDFGMVLLMRNGNVLIAQGIELSKRIPNQIANEKLYNAVQKAIKYIMDKINQEDDEIVASVIGLSNSYTSRYNRNILPFIINPILDNNHQFYNGIENYQGLLDLKEGKTLKDISLFVPSKFYYETNDIILRRDAKTSNTDITYRKIEKILISLRYAKFKTTPKSELIYYYNNLSEKRESYTICTLFWFITVFTDGSIDSFINSNNPLVIEQYNKELEKINRDKHAKIKSNRPNR